MDHHYSILEAHRPVGQIVDQVLTSCCPADVERKGRYHHSGWFRKRGCKRLKTKETNAEKSAKRRQRGRKLLRTLFRHTEAGSENGRNEVSPNGGKQLIPPDGVQR